MAFMIIGRGFIATALRQAELPEAVYYFGGVSSNALITSESVRKQMNDWLDVVEFCTENNLYLVYASSATAEKKETSYARVKAAMELFAPENSLGIRLPAVYGPGEEHKGKAASIVYQFCQQMKERERPEIMGDGTQTRDFMYIDDVVEAIKALSQRKQTGIVSIGTGVETTFNELVDTINTVLDTSIEPLYTPRPSRYVERIECTAVPYKVSLLEGVKRILHDTK